MTEQEDTIAGPGDPGASSDGEGGGEGRAGGGGGANGVRDREERQLPNKRKRTERREGMIKEETPAEPTKKSKNRPSYFFFS